MAIITLLESMLEEQTLLEIGGDINIEPKNFNTADNGEYSFDATFENSAGEVETIPMEVSIETDCADRSIYITFKEEGGGYTTTDRGETTREKLRIVSSKMTGIAYCVKYHFDNLACEVKTIKFSPIADPKDREADKNRRAKLYTVFAEKYLPIVLGIKKDDIVIQGKNTSNVKVILPSAFGGGGTIGYIDDYSDNDNYDDDDDTDIVQDNITIIDNLLDDSGLPSEYTRAVMIELNELHRDGNLSDGDMPVISRQDISDLQRVFNFLEFVELEWDDVDTQFGDRRYGGAVDLLFNYASRFRPSRIIEDMVFKMGIGASHIIDLIDNGYVDSTNVVDAVNRIIDDDPLGHNVDGRLLASLIRHIQSNPRDEDWFKINWNDIEDLESKLNDIAEDIFSDGDEYNKFKNAVGLGGSINVDYDDIKSAITTRNMDDIGIIMGMSPTIENAELIVRFINKAFPTYYENLKNNIISIVNHTKPRAMPLSQALKKRMNNLPYMSNDIPKELRFGLAKVIDNLYNTIISEVEEEEHPDDLEKYKYDLSKQSNTDKDEIYDSYKRKPTTRFKNIW